MNYKQALEDLHSKLQSNPNIKVLEFQIQEPASEEKIQAIGKLVKNQSGLELPAELLALYRQMNGFKLVWEPISELRVNDRPWNYPPSFNEWLPIENAFAGAEVNFYWPDENSNLEAAFHFFIDHDQEEQGTWLLSTGGDFELYYVHCQGEDVHRLGFGIDTYFEKFLEASGFFTWQDAITLKYDVFQDATFEKFDNWMPILFEGFDVHAYKA